MNLSAVSLAIADQCEQHAVISDYDKHAKSYHTSNSNVGLDEPFLTSFLIGLQPNSLVMDAGGGAGRLFPLIDSLGHRSLLIDLSFGLLSIARETQKDNLIVKMDLEHIALDDNTVDAVVAAYALVHMDDELIERIISELSRTAKPGAKFFFAFQMGDGFSDHRDALNALQTFNLMSVNRIDDILNRLGFAHIKFETRSPGPSERPFPKLYVTATKKNEN